MIFDDAQKNMNDAYFGGGTGGLLPVLFGVLRV